MCLPLPPRSRPAPAASSLQVALALVAAALSVLLYAPALRFMHSFWLQLNAPDWAADYIAPGPAATLGLLLHMVLPLLTTLMWVSDGARAGSRVVASTWQPCPLAD